MLQLRDAIKAGVLSTVGKALSTDPSESAFSQSESQLFSPLVKGSSQVAGAIEEFTLSAQE